MLLIPSFLLIISFASALFVWMFGPKRGIPLSIVIFILIGISILFFSKEMQAAFFLVGPFVLPLVIGAWILGAFSGFLLKTKWFPFGLVLFIPPILFVINTHSKQQDEKDIQVESMKFIKSEPQIIKLFGENSQPNLIVFGKDSDGRIGRLEYSFNGYASRYAIVDVIREKSAISFRLACVTSLYIGQRDVAKDACAQGLIDVR